MSTTKSDINFDDILDDIKYLLGSNQLDFVRNICLRIFTPPTSPI